MFVQAIEQHLANAGCYTVEAEQGGEHMFGLLNTRLAEGKQTGQDAQISKDFVSTSL